MSTRINNAIPPLDEIALGLHEGFEVVHKFGRNPSVSTSGFVTVWDGIVDYPYQFSDLTMTIQGAAGDEGVSIEVSYIDSNWDRHQKTVQLNAVDATTPVEVATNIMIPYRMRVVSDVTNINGNITLTNGGTTYAQITNGGTKYHQTQMALFPVPNDYVGVIYQVGRSTTTNKEYELQYKAKALGEAWQVKRPVDLFQQANSENFTVPYVFPEKTLLEVSAKATSISGAVSAWWDMIIIHKSKINKYIEEL